MAVVGRMRGWIKGLVGATLGLFSGAAAMYGTALVDTVVKPAKPVANFAVSADGLTVTCQNYAAGESGWWDFGDGSPLEPFSPSAASVSHKYTKPGSYSVKLTVRNFLTDENERTVPVDLTGSPQALPPTIAALKVEPIGPRAVAPATFRIRGEVQNAERVLWDLGDKVEVGTESGPFDRLVVFERPGQYPIQLIGHSGKQAVKQWAVVTVSPPSAGTLSAVLRVTDTGVRTQRQTMNETVPLPVPASGTRSLEKVVHARPGHVIVEATVGTTKTAAVKSIRTEVSADRRSAKLIGEWTAVGEEGKRAAGGSNVLVPLALVEEKVVTLSAPPATVSGLFQANGSQQFVTLPLPPQALASAGATRKMALELRQAFSDGRSRVVATVKDVQLPWTGQVNFGTEVWGVSSPASTVHAQQSGDGVAITIGF